MAVPQAVAHTSIVVGPGLSPLEGARIDVRIDDLLAEFTLTQSFRNGSHDDIEAVFTFPVPMDAVFLGLHARLGERELSGVVIEKHSANLRYEKAIASGDSAVLIERANDGALTASIGNLKPGESIEIRLRFAQWLSFNGRDVRFRMPTTIAPRYGTSPLPERDAPVVDLLAHYRFSARIDVHGLLAGAELSSPTHLVTLSRRDDGVAVALKGAWMDRDFILDAHLADADRCSAMAAPDGDGDVVTVAIAADLTGRQESLDISLVVDCSGSMGGVGIHYARLALKQILRSLTPSDQVNLVRFGSTHEKCLARPELLDVATRSRIEEYVAALEANMGGTEMIAALESAAEDLASTDGRAERSRVIFLITDGEINETRVERLQAICRKAGIRIFSVGVGAAVAEDTLRMLSDTTSGAVVFAPHATCLEAEIVSHFRRARAPVATVADVQWPGNPVWSHVPKTFLSGDTIRCYARFDHRVDGEVAVSWQTARPGQVRMPIRRMDSDALVSTPARMAAQQQLRDMLETKDRVALAVRYQLMSEVTSAILVAERYDQDKAGDQPTTVRVPQMMAAGWGDMAAADLGVSCMMKVESVYSPTVVFNARPAPSTPRPNPMAEDASCIDHALACQERITGMPKREIWHRADVQAMLQWMDRDFDKLLSQGGDLAAGVEALVLRWLRTEAARWPILVFIDVSSGSDKLRDFLGALLLLKLLVRNIQTPGLDALISQLRTAGVRVVPAKPTMLDCVQLIGPLGS
ncbi:MAG: VWA domain-containing protein [Xanthomonadales bacterium]|nr:VWA domain-containing protein [Xanthomonadales bacterium]